MAHDVLLSNPNHHDERAWRVGGSEKLEKGNARRQFYVRGPLDHLVDLGFYVDIDSLRASGVFREDGARISRDGKVVGFPRPRFATRTWTSS